MALTAKQQLFVAAYIECWHVTKAAIAAGYAERSAYSIGSENLKKPEIAAAIEAHIAAIMPAGEVLTRLAARARASIADVLALPVEDNPASWRLDLIKAQATGGVHQIKKIKSGKYGDEIETYDPLPALELLAKYHGMLIERHEHSGKDGAPLFPDFDAALKKTYAGDDLTTDPA